MDLGLGMNKQAEKHSCCWYKSFVAYSGKPDLSISDLTLLRDDSYLISIQSALAVGTDFHSISKQRIKLKQ